MTYNKGFTLLESLIYISCLSLFALVFFAMVNLFINTKFSLSLLRSKAEIIVGINLLLKDIIKAPNITSFKSIGKNKLIYKDFDLDLDIGWIVKSGNLYKYIGRYSIDSDYWIKKRSNLILQNLESIDFKYNKDILNILIVPKGFKSVYQVFVLPRAGLII